MSFDETGGNYYRMDGLAETLSRNICDRLSDTAVLSGWMTIKA